MRVDLRRIKNLAEGVGPGWLVFKDAANRVKDPDEFVEDESNTYMTVEEAVKKGEYLFVLPFGHPSDSAKAAYAKWASSRYRLFYEGTYEEFNKRAFGHGQ